MPEHHSLLIEIGTEELPPKHLCALSSALQTAMQAQLQKAALSFSEIQRFATPRRLALLIKELSSEQAEQQIERKGPALDKAFDPSGQPTAAALGFAKSCGVSIDELTQEASDKGSWLMYRSKQAGQTLAVLIPSLLQNALKQLPIKKPMRWSDSDIEFIRPVHWVVLLYGTQVISCDILGKPTNNLTYGHRFHHPEAILLKQADEYQHTLQAAYVIPCFAERRELIKTQVNDQASALNAAAVMPDSLVEEVTNLVEWPIAQLAKFDATFLTVPPEALISAMQDHQKCFALQDKQGKLLPHFSFISNLVSHQPQTVIHGNETVMRARLADAAFFFKIDTQTPLASRVDSLKTIVFHHKLGSVYEKSQRLVQLSGWLSQQLDENAMHCKRAALLAKTDLVTDMVFEFPELQGIMGYYYAQQSNEHESVALAIRDHYLPCFSGDALPTDSVACVVALADRLDTLTALFAVGQPPTGDKDPFALRRAAQGILRIIIERDLSLDLADLSQQALKLLDHSQQETQNQLIDFYFERLRAWYQDQGVKPDTLAAVIAKRPTAPVDFAKRVHAVTHFRTLAEAPQLAEANKRVSNLLRKEADRTRGSLSLRPELLQQPEEKALAQQLRHYAEKIKPLQQQKNYSELLTTLTGLQAPIEAFFNEVRVIVDQENLRNNRLALLQALRSLFLTVADLSLLDGTDLKR